MKKQSHAVESPRPVISSALEKFSSTVEGVLAQKAVTFEDNLVLASGCNPYGCTCIAHEKCCGCLLQ